MLYYTSISRVTIPLQAHHHTVLNVSARGHNPSTSISLYCIYARGSQSLYKYFTSLPRVTNLLQVHHHIVLYASVRGRNPSTSTSPYSTISLSPGSQYLYKYITILYFTSLPGVIITLQVHRHTILNVSARVQKPSTSTSPYCTLRLYPGSQSFYNYITILYFMYLPGVTILLQVYHHVVLDVSAQGENPSTTTSPYCTLLYLSVRGHNPSTSTSPYCTLRLCPGSQSFNKYITILYYTSLSRVTIPLQVHHHTVLYDSARGHNHSTSTSPHYTQRLCQHHHTVSYVSARGHNHSTSTSPYCTRCICPGSQSFYKYITMLYFRSLPGVTILLQVHHHTVLYVSARGHNPSTSTTPYCTLGLCPGSQSFYKCITILYFTSLPGIRIPLQIHRHTVLYVSTRCHNHSTSLPKVKIPLQLHHHTALYYTSLSQSFYKYITILYFTSLAGVIIPLQVQHHTVLYVSARNHNPSTSLPGFTIFQQIHHHTVLYVSARGHNPSTSTSPYSTIRLYPGSQCFYKFITKLYFTSLPGVTIPLQVYHHTVFASLPGGHNPFTSKSPYCTLRLCPGSQTFYKYITILYFTSLSGVAILLQVHHHTLL